MFKPRRAIRHNDGEQYSQLVLLHPEHDIVNAQADIVLVAGLGGHYINTWEAADRTLWPIHLLPSEIEGGIRVLSFHYNTTVRGTTSQAKIEDHARELLDKLDLDRLQGKDQSIAWRPIIFVGHSLGGMLVKRAIQKSREDWRFKHLWDTTRGAMFFATPHHGLDEASWPEFAAQVLQLSGPFPGILPTQKMLDQILINSTALLDITLDFRSIQDHLAFVNFTEGRRMRGMNRVLVDDGRGWMDAPKKRQRKIDGDHLGICRFSRHKNDVQAFAEVSEGIRYLMESSKALDQIEEDAKLALLSLCPPGFHGYSMAKEPTKGTCEWIQERQEFRDWLGEGEEKQMLWIQGPPACGKTFLAKHIITDLIPRANQEVAHCLLSNADPGRGDLEALLRATLHHALRLEPELIARFLVPPFLEATRERRLRDDQIWTRNVLRPMWPTVIAAVAAHRSLALVVDGFDEMARDCQQSFIDCLAEFETMVECQEHSKRVRVLLLSREETAGADQQLTGEEMFEKYTVSHDDILPDMAKTVMAELTSSQTQFGGTENSGDDEEHGNPLAQTCKAILKSPESTYLWATLAAEEVAHSQLATQVEAVQKLILPNIPKDIEALHLRVLNEVHKTESTLLLVTQVLRWVVFQMEPLSEAEFTTAIALGMVLSRQTGEPPSEQELESIASDIRTSVETHCGKILDLRSGQLQLNHSSIMNCLTSPERPTELAYMEEALSQVYLASVCVAYLTMPHFSTSGVGLTSDNSELWEAKVRKRIKEYSFLRYASLYWFIHIQAAGVSWNECDHSAAKGQRLLQDHTTEYSKCWTEVWWFLSKGSSNQSSFPEDTTSYILKGYLPPIRNTFSGIPTDASNTSSSDVASSSTSEASANTPEDTATDPLNLATEAEFMEVKDEEPVSRDLGYGILDPADYGNDEDTPHHLLNKQSPYEPRVAGCDDLAFEIPAPDHDTPIVRRVPSSGKVLGSQEMTARPTDQPPMATTDSVALKPELGGEIAQTNNQLRITKPQEEEQATKEKDKALDDHSKTGQLQKVDEKGKQLEHKDDVETGQKGTLENRKSRETSSVKRHPPAPATRAPFGRTHFAQAQPIAQLLTPVEIVGKNAEVGNSGIVEDEEQTEGQHSGNLSNEQQRKGSRWSNIKSGFKKQVKKLVKPGQKAKT
ncbi:hypothetical protein QBC35DRAFT_555176 [Podospora australis]|uniref:Nephrocystin 3-like N-terminal domain-containing protein n=1 Tax=Podospora australis TaxID=1536484 RepID=A0AAN6WRA7_9PEZI|nr:hypothetical protein QBC35DRAFT_555176 [Podospora australis]